MLEKITHLLKTGRRNNIELAHQLSISNKISLWPLERGIKDLLYVARTQPKIYFDNLPLGQLCYILKEVIALNISDVVIERLPEQLYFMPALVILELEDSPIKALPDSIGELSNLKSLSIKNTQIDRLPKSISALKNLERLTLVGNSKLNSLPRSLFCLPKLKTLRISPELEISLRKEDFLFEVIIEK
jgi:Leucine-rich repeat (LRR) protein